MNPHITHMMRARATLPAPSVTPLGDKNMPDPMKTKVDNISKNSHHMSHLIDENIINNTQFVTNIIKTSSTYLDIARHEYVALVLSPLSMTLVVFLIFNPIIGNDIGNERGA